MLTAGGAVAVMGAAVLVAWSLRYLPLIQILPGQTPTHRMSALGLLFSGMGLALAAANLRRAASLCAAFLLALASLVLLEYALGLNFGIDELLGPDYLNIHASHPGRMSPVSALCFFGTSMALMIIVRRPPDSQASTIAGILSSLLMAAGTLGALGHLLGFQVTYGWSQFAGMSTFTSAGVAALGAGLMAWSWNEGQENKAGPRWLPLGLGLGLAVGTLGMWQALMAHRQSQLMLISHTILAGGVVGAALVAVSVALAQKAREQSRELQTRNTMLEHLFDAQAAVRLGNQIFANMEEAVGLVRMEDSVIVHVNPKFEKMFGYGPDELNGKPVTEINAEAERSQKEVADAIRAELRRHGIWRGEILQRRKDSSQFWCAVTASIFHHPEFGEVAISIYQDVTELKKAQEALRESEERFRSVFEQGPTGVVLLGPYNRMAKANPAFCRMLGYSEAELAQKTPLEIAFPDDRASCASLLERLDRGEIPVCKMEKRCVKKNSEVIWVSLTASVILDPKGRPLWGLCMVEDITQRKQTEKKLAEQAALLDLAQDSITVRDLEGRLVFWNRGSKNMYGWTAEEALGSKAAELLDSRFPIRLQEIEHLVLSRGSWEGEIRQITRDGKRIVVASSWSLWRDESGAPRAFLVINRDTTHRYRTEEQLRSLTERLSLATQSASMGIWEWDLGNQCICDDICCETFGIPKAPFVAYEEFVRRVHPDDLPGVEASLQTSIRDKKQNFFEFRITRPDGEVRYISGTMGVILDERGTVVRLVGTSMDITDRKRTEEQLRNLTERLSLATQSASIGIWDWDLGSNQVLWDDIIFETYGIPKAPFVTFEQFRRRVHPDDLPAVEASLQTSIRDKKRNFMEFRIIRPDGEVRYTSTARGVIQDEHGTVVRVVGTSVDITERKRMEAEIEAKKEQLVTSARLSALGAMAGGIAHEINNPLGIIRGSAENILRMAEFGSVQTPAMLKNWNRINVTVDRISRIVGSLRHIAREGSADEFRETPVRQIVEETLELCSERFRAHNIRLDVSAVDPQAIISCREAQIGQVLLNLLQNAFDEVVTQEGEQWVKLDVTIRPPWVRLSITDSGRGIAPENRAHIMEPFFTTKPVGKGTGLGLSISRSIMSEHEGTLELDQSSPHTSFVMKLPLSGPT